MPDEKIKITKGTPSHTLGERLKFEVINPISKNEGDYLWNVFKYNNDEKQWKPIRTINGKSYKFECHFEKESSDGVTFQVRVYKNDKKPKIEENTLLDSIEVTPHKRIEKAPKIVSTHFFPEGEYDTNNKVSVYDSLHLRAKTEGLTGKEIQFHVCQKENGKEVVKDTVSARVDHTDYATTKIKLPIDTIKSILTNKNQENQKDYYIKASFGLDKNGKKSTGEITKTYFIDKQGNPIEKISIGDTIHVCIDSKGEIADFLQYTIYEKDKHTSDDVIFQSPKFKLNNNHFFCREIVVTKELFNKGYGVSHAAFDSDYNVQDYYIKVERFSGSANSKTFAVTSDTLKVHYGKSPVKVTVNEKKVEQLPLLKDIFLPALKIETANKISSGKETLHINSEKETYCILAPQNILEVKQDGRTRQIDVPITSINQNSMHIHFSVSHLGGRKYGYIYPIISTMPNTEKDYRDHQQIEKSITGKIFVDSKERTTPFGDLVYKIYPTTTHIDFEITIKDNIDKDIYIDFFYCEYNGLTIAVKERLCYKLRLFESKNDVILQFVGKTADENSLSEKTKNILREVGQASGNYKIIITSTARTPYEQARIMYDNCKKNLEEQKRTYQAPGKKVVQVYEDNYLIKSREEVIKLMEQKIIELGPTTVSKHLADPIRLNTFDISYGQLKDEQSFWNEMKKRKELDKILKENRCYHIQIKQD
ncbi:hypothetical protein [Capnocytophaga sp. oral taxon 326]|uniref:hypothetical protein n=1 Tax=Capnocytophaga sp. oral taxon 326 TaxID=712212 RepID=UPI0002A43E83|nr:hypothetical protein [Capnocytophaga sp. oral taxon 326]EKY10746.1 hypothetical protein HMPREF9073_03273 [Capnocytophaga sp. oral taxon 326 str. F0382]